MAALVGVGEVITGAGGEAGSAVVTGLSGGAAAPVAVPVALGSAVAIRHGVNTIDRATKSLKAEGSSGKQQKEELKIGINEEHKIDRDLLNPPTKHGNSPTFKKDGSSVEIHHEGQNPNGPFREMHKSDHRGKGNDAINHPNKSKPSQVDRKEFDKARREYWKEQYPKQ